MEKQPWWKDSVDEMLAMLVLGAVVWLSLHYAGIDGVVVAGAGAGGLVTYLGKGKNNKS
jgi:uncharacterized membrane protein